jgi:hypothetical protein
MTAGYASNTGTSLYFDDLQLRKDWEINQVCNKTNQVYDVFKNTGRTDWPVGLKRFNIPNRQVFVRGMNTQVE